MLENLYQRVLRFADHKHAPLVLGTIAFLESSIFPIPPDLMLVPMALANKDRAWFFGILTGVCSVLGGIAGYAIGFFFFETIGKAVVETYGYTRAFIKFQELFNEWGFLIIVIKGFTPIPYKVVTIASGMTKLDLGTFILASSVSRIPRFLIQVAILWKYGDQMKTFIERNLKFVTYGFMAILTAGIFALKFL